MIGLGDKLGARYFVVSEIDPARFDLVHEVRDAQGQILWAQIVSATPLTPTVFDALKAELGAIPNARAYRRPDEVLRSSAGYAAVIFRQPHPQPLVERLPGMFAGDLDDRRRASLRTLVGWFAPLAEELNNLHAVGVVHGAITLERLHVHEDRGTERLVLSGFGVDAASRLAVGRPRPPPRADFASLALALQAAMERTKVRADGAALVRWELIRNCARAGDHPALQSGLALANAIRSLIDEPARRISSGTLTAVGSTASQPAERLPNSPLPSPPPDPSGSYAAGSDRVRQTAFTAPPPDTAAPQVVRRRRIGVAAALVLAVLATSAIVSLSQKNPLRDMAGPLHARVSVPTRCGDELLAPPSAFATSGRASDVVPVCFGDGRFLGVIARVDDTMVVGRRRAARGERFDEGVAPIADAVGALGTAVSSDAGWIAWTPREGFAFGLARVDRAVTRIPIQAPQLQPGAYRGAFLLRAEPLTAWVASTLREGGRSRPVIVQFASRYPDQARAATVFALGDGEVVAAIPGEPATLLVQRVADGHLSFSTFTVPLQSLAGLVRAGVDPDAAADADAVATADAEAAPPPDPLAPREISSELLRRSAAWAPPSSAVRVEPAGAGADGSPVRFLATVFPAEAGCTSADCAAPGSVQLVEFPPHGDPVAREIERQASAASMSGTGAGVVLTATRARDGVVLPFIIAAGGEVRPQRWVLNGLLHPSVVSCGDEAWLAFAPTGPQPRAGAVPLGCALR